MNTKTGITMLAITALLLSACGGSGSDKQGNQAAMSANHDSSTGMQHDMDMQTMDMEMGKAHAMVQLPTIQCENCKTMIEEGLAKTAGIQSVHVDLEGKVAHINYDDTQLKLKDIEQVIAKLGYQANDTPADSEAYSALPDCCKMPQ